MIEQTHKIQLWMLRVYYISWQLYYIGHVTSIVFHYFQGRPYHLAPLTSLWRHDFSPDTHSATDRRSLFGNLFVHYLMNRSFMAYLASVCGLEQTKLLDVEFKYLIIFSIWVKSTLLKWNKNIHHVINTISIREKYSFIGCHWIYSYSTRGVSKSCKTLGKPRVLHGFDTLGWNGRIFNGSLWNSLIIFTDTTNLTIMELYHSHKLALRALGEYSFWPSKVPVPKDLILVIWYCSPPEDWLN